MKQIVVNAGGGLSVVARVGREDEVIPLGVAVEFHPGIPEVMRQMSLETVLRHWKLKVGSVTRVNGSLFMERETWLRGWTIQAFQQGSVISMRIAFRVGDEEMKERIA